MMREEKSVKRERVTVVSVDYIPSDHHTGGNRGAIFIVERADGSRVKFINNGEIARESDYLEAGDTIEISSHGATYSINSRSDSPKRVIKREIMVHEGTLSMIEAGPPVGVSVTEGWEERVAEARSDAESEIARLRAEIEAIQV